MMPRRIEYSLAVITFQSEMTIGPTLASLENLEGLDWVELILADDGSTDRTVRFVSDWLARNASRFGSVQTVFSKVNRGVAATHTAAFASAKGVWGLYLGGDDFIDNPRFFPELSEAVSKTPGRIFRTRVHEYYRSEGRKVDFYDSYAFVLSLGADRQFRFLACSGTPFRSGPGTIFHVETLRRLDAFGNYNRMYEDWTLFLRFTRAGFAIRFLDVPGVLWQRHPASISSGSNAKMRSWDSVVRRIDVTPHLSRLSLFERWRSRHRGRLSRRLNEWYRQYLRYLGPFLKPSLPVEVVVVRLNGGLGDQLFQYRVALEVAKRDGSRVFYHWQEAGRPEIADRVPIAPAPNGWIEVLLGSSHAWGGVIRRLRDAPGSPFRLVWREPTLQTWKSPKRAHGPAYISGSWLSYQPSTAATHGELSELASQLQEGLGSDPYLNRIESKVVVHVGPGLTEDYYRLAMEKFSGPQFLFISDDPDYCRLAFGSDPRVEVVPDKRMASIDLRLMIRAGGVIIGNSTLSWWGAYLNQAPAKKVVAPRLWLSTGPGRRSAAAALFPPEWILL